MKHKKFYDGRHANQYLRGSIIRYKGVPIIVRDIFGEGKKMRIAYSELDQYYVGAQDIALDNKDIDMNPVPLGNLSFFYGDSWETFYASRLPVKRWKVGLALENFTLERVNGGGFAGNGAAEKVFYSKNLIDCIMGNYRSIQEAMDLLKAYPGTIPLSRNFSMSNGDKVYYKAISGAVGSVSENGKVKLSAGHQFLKELVQEELNANCG